MLEAFPFNETDGKEIGMQKESFFVEIWMRSIRIVFSTITLCRWRCVICTDWKEEKIMVLEIILFVIAMLLIGAILYSVFCYAPGEESRREEREERENG